MTADRLTPEERAQASKDVTCLLSELLPEEQDDERDAAERRLCRAYILLLAQVEAQERELVQQNAWLESINLVLTGGTPDDFMLSYSTIRGVLDLHAERDALKKKANKWNCPRHRKAAQEKIAKLEAERDALEEDRDSAAKEWHHSREEVQKQREQVRHLRGVVDLYKEKLSALETERDALKEQSGFLLVDIAERAKRVDYHKAENARLREALTEARCHIPQPSPLSRKIDAALGRR